jgi:phosphonoacetaldehyde hydrolase
MEAIVKVDDTTVGIEAGLNAGMWTVGISRAGNLVGLSEEELNKLELADQTARVQAAAAELSRCGAHVVIDSIRDLPTALAHFNAQLAHGGRP